MSYILLKFWLAIRKKDEKDAYMHFCLSVCLVSRGLIVCPYTLLHFCKGNCKYVYKYNSMIENLYIFSKTLFWKHYRKRQKLYAINFVFNSLPILAFYVKIDELFLNLASFSLSFYPRLYSFGWLTKTFKMVT